MKRGFSRLWPVYLVLAATIAVVTIILILGNVERHSTHEVYPKGNYSLVEDGLYVGGMLSEPPPGVEAVLNVCETRDPYEVRVHRWEPIPDMGPAPDLDWLRAQVAFIDQERKAGRSVYVHCRAGINRSVTVATAFLMWRDRLTRDEALALIRESRPRARPNDAYSEYLMHWEKSLFKSRTSERKPGRVD